MSIYPPYPFQTADAWGNDIAQCMAHGYYTMPTIQCPVARNVTLSFPATYSQLDVCDQYAYTAPLVDRQGNKYGTVIIFKDYDDILYVSPQLWALTNSTPTGQLGGAYFRSAVLPGAGFSRAEKLPDRTCGSDPGAGGSGVGWGACGQLRTL
eukprot:gene10826-16912_t